jgi:peptide/nickel transport system permease protein
MWRYFRRGILQVFFVAVGITLINFFLLRLAPGDAAQALAGASGAATPEYMAALRQQFGLDQPLYTQFLLYAKNLLGLDLGFSFHQGLPVTELIWQRLPATLLLMLAAIIFALFFGCVTGLLSALRPGGPTDTLISALTMLLYATPTFWVGIMLMLIFSVRLDWLPVGGMFSIEKNLSGIAFFLDVGRHLILPAITLGLYYFSIYSRLMRAGVIEIYGMDFIRTARAKGVRPHRVVLRHVLRNALLPIVTTLGVQLSSILGGAVLVETVFAWPGLGRLAFSSLFQRDVNLLLGILFCSAVVVVLVNMLIDLLYTRLDPRIKLD